MSDEYPDTPEKLQDFADDLGRTISKAQSEFAAPNGSVRPTCPRCKTYSSMHYNRIILTWICWECSTYWNNDYLSGWNDGYLAFSQNAKVCQEAGEKGTDEQ